MSPLDLKAIRERASEMLEVRGDDGGAYPSWGWAEEVADSAIALCSRVEELEAALRAIDEEASLQAMRGIQYLARRALEGKS